MKMSNSVFIELEFFALVICSLILPVGVYVYALLKRAISRNTVLLLGVVLIVLSGIDIYLLQRLAELARHSPSVFDDVVFTSEIAMALYLLPALSGGRREHVVPYTDQPPH